MKISKLKLQGVYVYLHKWGKKKLAKRLGVSKTHLCRILRKIKIQGLPSVFNSKVGRKPAEISQYEKDLVMKYYLHYRLGATSLEKLIRRDAGVQISHNKIHKILKEEKLVMELSRKRKNYNWVRYEKDNPNELWHTDWTEINYKGRRKYFIAIIDDNSRFIVGYGMFNAATSENSVFVLQDAINLYGKPEAVMSDKGIQFYACTKEGWKKGKTEFERFLEKEGIRQVLSRVKHPQSNGKIERFFGTLKQKLHMFADIHDFVDWYNNIKPHMSLDLNTPAQVFKKNL